MYSIIDAHTHLGNILDPDGGSLIERKGAGKTLAFDPISLSEALLHRDFGGGDMLFRLILKWVVKAERARNLTATRENIRISMDEAGVVYSACMPVPPYVTFEDLERAAEKDRGIVPFTGVDYTRECDLQAELDRHVSAGARGLKLHPVIQCMPLNSRKTFEAVEAFAPHGLPVLFHCGYSSYYLNGETGRERPDYGGNIAHAETLIRAFPGVKFIAGHAGMYQVREVIGLLAGYPNVFVDISFQSPEKIRELFKSLGPERVLYGSDWPWGSRLTAIRTLTKACRGNKSLERLVFFENAAELMKLGQ